MDKDKLKVLLVDDDPEFAGDFKMLLPANMDCSLAPTVERAQAFLREKDVDVVFLDIKLGPGGDGFELLADLKKEYPYLPVIMVTADRKIESAVKAIRLGASDYVSKCPDLNDLRLSVERAISESRLQQRYHLLESELDEKIDDLIGESEVMRRIKSEIKRLAGVSSSVLITGLSGTGKELVARNIHRLSALDRQPFVAVNCAALSRELIESELFGHEKGAFTGAHTRRIGKFELADSGTLFLDEITEIPIAVQSKFLRVLQENEFERVGGNRMIKFKGRILASSNRDIDQAVKGGILRRDLLYRLDVTRVHLPPLSDRREDIPLLADYFVKLKSHEMKKRVGGISELAMKRLCAYEWPGNIRELINSIESAVVRTDAEILDINDFDRIACDDTTDEIGYEEAKRRCLTAFQRKYISSLLKRNNNNLTKTAEEIGISRQGLVKIMKSCGLRREL